MRKLLALLLLSALILPISGFSEIEKIPTTYSYGWDPTWLLNPEEPYRWNRELGVRDANVTSKKVIDALTDEERKAFSGSLARFEAGDRDVRLAKERLAEASFWRFFYSMVSSDSNRLFFGVIASTRESEGTVFGLAALSESAAGGNDAMRVLDEEASRLEWAGAGMKNYTGGASGAYNSMKEALAAIEKEQTVGDGLGNKYARTLGITKEISESGKPSEFGNLADAIELISASDQSVFSNIVNARRDSKAALEQMETEYVQLERLCEGRISALNAEISRMKGDEYGSIDGERVVEFYDGSFRWGKGDRSPAESLKRAALLVDNKGFEQGAEQTIADARETARRKEENYLAVGIMKAGECLEKARGAETEIRGADALVATLLERARSLASQKGSSAKGAIEGFSPTTLDEKELYQSALSKYEKAEAKAETAGSAKPGTALKTYSESIGLYGEVLAALSSPTVYLEDTRGTAKKSIAGLKKTLEKARADGLDVSVESDYADSAEGLLGVAKRGVLESIISTCKEYQTEIERRAQLKYSGLEDLREEISGSFEPGKRPIAELQDDYGLFEDYEDKFVENGAISPRLALGEYKKLESFYERFSEKIARYKAVMIQKNLEENSESRIIFEGVQVLDGSAPVSVEVVLRNTLETGYSGPVAPEVQLELAVSSAEITEKSPEIENVAYADGKLLVLLKKVDPKGQYRVAFRGNKTIGETRSKNTEDRFVWPNALIRKVSLRFISKIGTTVQAGIALPERPALSSADINGVGAEVEVWPSGTGVVANVFGESRKGDNLLTAEFVFQNPITVSKRAAESPFDAANTFSYVVDVSSNFAVKDAPVYVFEPALKEGDATVTGFSGSEPENLMIERSGDGGRISWTVGELVPGANSSFRISVKVNDEISLAKRLYNETEFLVRTLNLSNTWAGDELARADGMIQTGAYKKAIGILEEARDRIEKELQGSEENQRLLDEELNALLKKIEAANLSISEMRAMGYETANETKALEAAVEKYGASKLLASEGNYEEALAAAETGIEKVGKLGYEQLFRKRDSASSQLAMAKRNALLLSQLENTGGIVSEIEANEAILREAEAELGRGNYLGAMPLLEKAERGAANSSLVIDGMAEAWYSKFELLSAGYRKSALQLKEQLQELGNAFMVSETRVGKTGAPEPSFSLNDAGKKIDGIAKHLENVLGTKNGSEFVIKNAQNLKIAFDEVNELEALGASFSAEFLSLQNRAGRSRENSAMALDQLAEIRGGEEDIGKEIAVLRGYLSDSEKALSEGRLADSVVLSSYVQKRSASLLKLPKKDEGDSNALLVGGVSVLLLLGIVAIFLLRGRKAGPPPEPKSVPRAGKRTQESQTITNIKQG